MFSNQEQISKIETQLCGLYKNCAEIKKAGAGPAKLLFLLIEYAKWQR